MSKLHRRSVTTLLAVAALQAALSAQGIPIGFEETYALAPDRQKVVDSLIPGTDDFYYYHCRERLDARDFATVRKVLPTWIQRHGHNQRVIEIENRESLLSAADNPERTFALLRQRLGTTFDHQRVVPGAKSDLPSRLDPAMLSAEALTARALANSPEDLDGFTDDALPALAARSLSAAQLRSLLQRLDRPDVDNLPALVVRDLESPRSSNFGSLSVHRLLRLPQLEECLRLRPALLQEPAFVDAYLTRLQPSVDTGWQNDAQQHAAQLQRLWSFAQRLSPAFNSLKAHVLYNWLQHDLTQGAPDKDRFLAYIRLPRRSGHVPNEIPRSPRPQDTVDPMLGYPTGLPVIGDDEPLLRASLESFFVTEDDVATYAQFLDADWLKAVLAETKMLLGQGDMERWYSLLNDPTHAALIEKRVEITFPPMQRTQFGADDAVMLQVDTKNVPTLLVKVYAIDAYRYLIENQRPVDATIQLDGIVANESSTHTYSEPPLRRVRRTFDMPRLREPGTYVVEFVGNGISSRAVIQKGGLRLAERTTAAGQALSVFDEAGAPVRDATAWFGGREYTPDDHGELLIPFTTAPGEHQIVLRHGNLASIQNFAHRAESYSLAAHIHVDREALIAGGMARIVVRPHLRLADRDVSLKLLQDTLLTIVATDLDGRAMPQELRGFTLTDDGELVHELHVPERLQSIAISLSGKVKDLLGNDVRLDAGSTTFQVNAMDTVAATAGVSLLRTRSGYALELRGKDGELRAGRTVVMQLRHRDYTHSIEAVLQTGTDGRVQLGELTGIDSMQVTAGGVAGGFRLATDHLALPDTLQGGAGTTLRIACPVSATSASRQEFSLLGSDRDRFEHLAVKDGMLELRDLPAGDYELRLHREHQSIAVHVTAGPMQAGWIVGKERILQASPTTPLQLLSIEAVGDEIVVRLANNTPDARVHVVATRYVSSFPLFAYLGADSPAELRRSSSELPTCIYQSGRKLGDEYRYVLERRQAKHFPGNLLTRPSLLLNPWRLDETSFNQPVGRDGQKGGEYGRRPGASPGGPTTGGPAGTPASPAPGQTDLGTFANLDYLPRGSLTLTNLRPDKDGVVRIKAADLGDGQLVHVLAIEGDQAVSDVLVRDEKPLQPRVRHLNAALDAGTHLTEQKRIEFVGAGNTATLEDPRAAQVEIFDSIAGVHRIFTAISHDADLAQFAFVLDWPKRSAAEKQKLYSEHACHELSFFLYHKDRAFFDAVIKPFLANKLDRTFLDHWLLGDDLTGYVEPWAFEQLNLIEKLLLAQRLEGDAKPAVARLAKEQLELKPVDRQQLGRLFDLALGSKVLDPQNDLRSQLGLLAHVAHRGLSALAAEPAKPGQQLADDLATADTKLEESRRNLEKDKKDADRGEAPNESAFDSNQWNSAVGLGGGKESERLLRGRAKQLYRAVNPTKLLVEQNYWHRRLANATADVVAPNQFWVDYATAPAGKPFVSAAIVEASNSFLEMMMALAVLDLPFEAGKHEVTADGDTRTLRAATPLLLVRKEVTKTEKAADVAPMLLGENFFRLDDRYRFDNGQRRDAFVSDEFLVDVAYGCQVVVTNPTSMQRTAEVLLQVPAGAIPVQRGFWTKGVTVELPPYGTQTVEYAFYFPKAGDFAHYPAHAAEKASLAAFAEPRTLHVVDTPSKLDITSWEHVSQQGTDQDVMTFLDTHNVQRLDLDKVAWRMKDRDFFGALLTKLRARHVYQDTLWSYALLHRDLPAAREYLEHATNFLQQCGAFLDSPLVVIDPKQRKQFEQIELDPLVHARAHRFGGQRVLGNQDLARQYLQLMTILGYHPTLDADDWLVVTYYFLLQDRVEEALQSFAKVDASKVHTKVQYDYLSAYLCFFTGDTAKARQLAEQHKDDAVPHWQKRFRDVLAQLDEIAGKAAAPGEPTADSLAATAPALELAIEGKQITVNYKNLAQCEVRYYELDVEFAFSAQPFASEGGTSAAFVQPNAKETRDLPPGQPQMAFELPKALQQKNVLVEVRAAGLVRSQQYFANNFDVRFLESYGQIAVTEPGTTKPLPQTYVKVFARLGDGSVRFHKDGYTDLRGRFDYASVSDDPNANATKYAVLVLHDQRGAVIREVAPPTK